MGKVTVIVHIELDEADRKAGWIAHADAIRGAARGKNQVDAIVKLFGLVQLRPELWEPQEIQRS